MAVIPYHGSSPEPKAANDSASKESANSQSHEFHAEDFLMRGKDKAQDLAAEFERIIHEKPRAALLAALGAGFVLRRLPLGKILATQIKLTAKMVPTAVLAFGAAKLYEAIKKAPKNT